MIRIIFVLAIVGILAVYNSGPKPQQTVVIELPSPANQASAKAAQQVAIKSAEPQPLRVDLEILSKILAEYKDDIAESSLPKKLDPRMTAALLYIESRGDPNAVSEKGAQGCMQTLPIIDEDIGMEGKDSFDCPTSIEKSTRYQVLLRTRYGFTDPNHMLIAYNRGPTGIKKCTFHQLNHDKYLSDLKAVVAKIPLDTFS